MISDVQSKAKERMTKAVDALKKDLQAIRTGRASSGLLDHIRVDYYGTPTPLSGVATINVPESRLIVVQPWDRNLLGPIEKAIQTSDLGITPNNDGAVIRLQMPQLTEQRRKELSKQVQKRVEEGRIAIRNVRREAHDDLRKLEKDKTSPEDEVRRSIDQLQKTVDGFIADVDKVGKEKEQELMAI